MISLLSKWFIKDNKNYMSPTVRSAYGMLCGAVGIFLNILLFGLKLLAGAISGSIAITADAFNNLSDASSSLITLVGFRMAKRAPDEEHPYGHGRIEYIAGLMVALLIMLMAFELGKTSFEKILHPETVVLNLWVVLILLLSIGVKLYMFLYNRRIGKRIHSAAMGAVALDSLSDIAATSVTLIVTVLGYVFGWKIDGYAGIVVALFIFYTGIQAVRDILRPLLGQAPNKRLVEQVQKIAYLHPEILGVHDIVVHDYGPGRRMISLHAEVSADADLLGIHEVIDAFEKQLDKELACESVVHMDPVEQDKNTVTLRREVISYLKSLDPCVAIHDFRIIKGPSHDTIVFGIVVPYDFYITDTVLEKSVEQFLRAKDESFVVAVHVDKQSFSEE